MRDGNMTMRQKLGRIVVDVATVLAMFLAWFTLQRTPDPDHARIVEACMSARDLVIDFAQASRESQVERLENLTRSGNRADESLYQQSVDALAQYKRLARAIGTDARNDAWARFGHALFDINEYCRANDVAMTPSENSRACGYLLVFVADIRAESKSMTFMPRAGGDQTRTSGLTLLELADDAESADLRRSLLAVPRGYAVSRQIGTYDYLDRTLNAAATDCNNAEVAGMAWFALPLPPV